MSLARPDTLRGMASWFFWTIAAVAAAASGRPANAWAVCAAAGPSTAGTAAIPRPMALPPSRRVEGSRVAIPFAPPIGETLRYRLRSASGSLDHPRISEVIFSLSFERTSGGYLMTIARAPNRGQRPARRTAATAFAERPMTFRLDTGARVVGMEDEAAFWAAFSAVPEGQATPEEPALQHLLAWLRLVRDDPAEERIPTLAALAAPVLRHAGATFVLGDVRPGLQTVPTMFGTSQEHVSGYATRVARRHLFVAVASSPPAMQLEPLLQSSLPPDHGTNFDLRASSHRFEAEVSLSTGLVRRAFTEVRADVDWDGRCWQLTDSHEVTLIGRRASGR